MRYVIATLCALATLLIAPAGAFAVECPQGEVEANGSAGNDWPVGGNTGRCVAFSEWQSERAAAQQAHEAQEQAEAAARKQKEANERHAREAAEKKETGGPPTKLHVTVVSEHGSTYKAPGRTLLYVDTDEYAEVFFRFTYPQHRQWKADTFHFKERPGKEANPEAGENDAADDPWSCRAPMLVEDWEVQVRGENGGVLESGPGLVQHGQILDNVSAKWCAKAKRREHSKSKRPQQKPTSRKTA